MQISHLILITIHTNVHVVVSLELLEIASASSDDFANESWHDFDRAAHDELEKVWKFQVNEEFWE